MRSLLSLGVAFGACAICGCTTVPPLAEDGIAVTAIVKRIKCEIAYAIPEPQGRYPTGPFQWTKYWAAKVELTLKTNSKSTVSPSGVFNRIWPDFTLGLNGSVETGADRIEVMTFGLTFADMRELKRSGTCNLPDGIGLYGHLGLREWLQSALAPVNDGTLTVGYHPLPSGKSTPGPDPLPHFEGPQDEELLLLKEDTRKLEKSAEVAQKYLKSALENVKRFRNESNDSLQVQYKQRAYDDASYIVGAFLDSQGPYSEVGALFTKLIKRYPAEGTVEQKQNNKIVVEEKDKADKAYGVTKTAKETVSSVLKKIPSDPPITTISHSLNFAVELKGGMTPNWTLVSVRGPASSGSLLSGSYTRTHMLSIVMGNPAENPDEIDRQLSTLAITQSLQALGAR